MMDCQVTFFLLDLVMGRIHKKSKKEMYELIDNVLVIVVNTELI